MCLMSGGAVFQEVLRIVGRQQLPDASCRDILAVLESNRKEPLEFLYQAGIEATLSPEQTIIRAASIYFNLCAGSLCDDLSDGDCTYLAEPYRLGPCTQAILHALFFHSLAETGLPTATISAVARELAAAIGPQHIELRTKRWTAAVFRQVAMGIGGRQWSAYMQVLWYGTPLTSRAAAIGMKAGIAAIVREDIQSRDRRYTTLSRAHKREVVKWAVGAVRALRAEHLRCIDAALQTIDPVLRRAL
jgi:hypothetical protein